MPRGLELRCATDSVARGEPVLGTASRVRRWLLLEQPGPWGENVPLDSRLESQVAQTLRSRSRRAGVRLVLMRRPGWRKPEHGPRAYLAHSGRRSRWIEQLDLDDPRDLLDVDLAAAGEEHPPGVGAPGPDAVHLVCTNGRHDPCCADLGRPVVNALDAAAVPEVWESSHVGGDRFAANVVCLPRGVYFGRVDPAGAVELLADYAGGRVDLDHYRGRSCLPPLVQAAEIYGRRHLGEDRLDALRVVSAAEGAGGELAVRLDHDGTGGLEVTVRRERGEEEQLTCNAKGLATPWRYLLVDVRAA